jgi:tRNA (guanine37-N1)-methyltransferase
VVVELAAGPGPLIVCGRFEGIDQRVIEARGLEEVSLGDYVLSGGEIAALALIDACVRLLARRDGQAGFRPRGELFRRLIGIPAIYPPAGVRGPADPGNPASGDHAKVAAWRRAEAEALTKERGGRTSGRPIWRASKNAKNTTGRVTTLYAFAVYERQIRAMAG